MQTVLQTERLVLKPVDETLLDSAYAYAGNPENAKMMIFLPHADKAETERLLREAAAEWQKEQPVYYEFGIFFEEKHIGAITVYRLDEPGSSELGWILHKDYWNRGFVTEAAKAAIRFSAETLGLRRVIACCDSANPASYRVMEKLGMKLIKNDGVRKNRIAENESTELTYELLV